MYDILRQPNKIYYVRANTKKVILINKYSLKSKCYNSLKKRMTNNRIFQYIMQLR